jgi:hypothetical protein
MQMAVSSSFKDSHAFVTYKVVDLCAVILRDKANTKTEGATKMTALFLLLCAARSPSACRVLSTYSSQRVGLQL